jgi:hypothetical protein
MTNDQLREDYLGWLAPQLGIENGNPGKTYNELLIAMFEKEFGWVLPMDENRMVDGTDLRVEYARKHHIRPNTLEFLGGCSFLEVLIGLSRRLSFAAGEDAPGWAWQLICNLELHKMPDPLTRHKYRKVQEIMDGVIGRTYAPDGTGGFFPLAWPDDDQTTVELWYQMHSFVEELHPEHRR